MIATLITKSADQQTATISVQTIAAHDPMAWRYSQFGGAGWSAWRLIRASVKERIATSTTPLMGKTGTYASASDGQQRGSAGKYVRFRTGMRGGHVNDCHTSSNPGRSRRRPWRHGRCPGVGRLPAPEGGSVANGSGEATAIPQVANGEAICDPDMAESIAKIRNMKEDRHTPVWDLALKLGRRYKCKEKVLQHLNNMANGDPKLIRKANDAIKSLRSYGII
jgi:hypothetical protein